MLPEIIITPLSSLTSVTATSSTGKVYNGTFGNGVWTITVDDFDTYTISGVGTSETTEVVVDVCKQYEVVFPQPSGSLNDNSWAAIRYASDNNLGESLWSVGDAKQITLDGTIGTVNFNSYNTWVYILGFNHNAELEGNNRIHFGCFRKGENYTSTNSIALVDSYYGKYQSYNGTKYFQMNHWGSSSNYNTNYGGWAACDMRYDILGSTNVAPTPYGSVKTTSATGGNPTNTCVTSPVANTLMSALPADLRAVMKPITKYTDNNGNGSDVAANVTATIDYLPLLSEFEVQGARSYANQYEQNYQAQYAYYSAGNSKVKYRHATGSTANWWLRSVVVDNSYRFCLVSFIGSANNNDASFSLCLAPAFCV